MTTPDRIDLNADLGEGCGDDDAMLQVVTSANVACGGHAGDTASMQQTCRSAVAANVAIGAHLSYVDREGFGRRDLDVSSGDLVRALIDQLHAIREAAASAGGVVRYVKPHGALYNRIVVDEVRARDVADAVVAVDSTLTVLGLAESAMLRVAGSAGLETAREAFADRAYLPSGALVPRSQAGSVLSDPELVAERMVRLLADGTVAAIDGTPVRIAADSICVHGDSPGAVRMAKAVRTRLVDAGVELSRFVR